MYPYQTVHQSNRLIIMLAHDIIMIVVHKCLANLQDSETDVNRFEEMHNTILHKYGRQILVIGRNVFEYQLVDYFTHST